MGDYIIVGLTLNWDIKAILCCGFHFNTLGLRYKIEAYKHTYQPRPLPLGCIVSPFLVHLPVGPPWDRHCERLLFMGVCGWFSSCRSGLVSVLDSLLFSFFFSSFCLPLSWYQPGPFCLCLFFLFQRAIQWRCGGGSQNAHTQQAQHCMMGTRSLKKKKNLTPDAAAVLHFS